jgi:glycosyltransferase involved in cell wall biosynthesis
MQTTPKWICAQMGGREHYAIPRALHATGDLRLCLTDFYAGNLTLAFGKRFSAKPLRALAARNHVDLPTDLVKSWNLRSLGWEAELRRMARQGVTERYQGYCEVGKHFTEAAIRHLRALPDLPDHGLFFGYDTASLEIMEFLKERGFRCVLDQIDPCRVEVELVKAEQKLWPGWEESVLDVPEEFYARHHQEWSLADRVMVNSEWSRQALVQQGVPAEKLVVVPLCYERDEPPDDAAEMSSGTARPIRDFKKDPLRVLFLGQVMLRKGIQYLVEAARLMQSEKVRFDVVGPIHVSAKAVADAPSNLVFHGRVTRDRIPDWYRKADVFVLPTLSDGFAITQIEAMAHGLPVITTPNCGAVVSDGVDGFVVPPRDTEALLNAIRNYLENPGLLGSQGWAALQKSGRFSLSRVAADLQKIERGLRSNTNF